MRDKTRLMEQDETAIARQQHDGHPCAATNAYATVEELWAIARQRTVFYAIRATRCTSLRGNGCTPRRTDWR
jgi:hypothetical protein